MTNEVRLQGYLGQDPQISQMPDGRKVANLSLATSESYKTKEGQWKTATEWHKIVVFSPGIIELLQTRAKKATKLQVFGKLKTRKWQQNGMDRYTTEVVVEGFKGMIDFIATFEKDEPVVKDKGLNGYVEEDDEILF